MPSPRYRLAVVANRPQPYHSALFRALAAHAQIDLTVYYLFDVGVGAAPDPCIVLSAPYVKLSPSLI